VGLGSFNLDAFAVISPAEILMSFPTAGTIPDVGSVDDSDIVKFNATSLGQTTAGTFSLLFDGSDVGLSTNDEDIDAIELLPDLSLLVSTSGPAGVSGTSAQDEDLLRFVPTSLGTATAGTWSMFFDGSDVGLATSDSEDVDALAVDGAGLIYLSTVGNFSVPGRSGADEDVFVFKPATLGSATSGTYNATLFFDGSSFGLGSTDISGIDLP
jgi:hypothetical protein